MTTINKGKNICTLINVFTTTPEKHLELFKLLKEAIEDVMGKLPGYIFANRHISDDKTITKYADFQNMLNNKEAKEHMKKAGSLDFKKRF